MNSLSIDWSEEGISERFDLTCPNTEYHEKNGYNYENEKSEGCPACEDDSGHVAPMMNYLYPLDYTHSDIASRALDVALETNCVLVQNTDTEEWFLTLTGGGMDLSPSIAYAYVLAQTWIPKDLLHELKAGWCKDSLSEEKFKKLRKTIREQLKQEKHSIAEKTKEWNQKIEEITQ